MIIVWYRDQFDNQKIFRTCIKVEREIQVTHKENCRGQTLIARDYDYKNYYSFKGFRSKIDYLFRNKTAVWGSVHSGGRRRKYAFYCTFLSQQ